ncbi:MAG: nucleotide sugar dehydrogenase [Verrucomicrobia bacterium]|jgi:UDP-N-acetyl-D-glucosamine dehydrogenase|nr:nucleotide sugar dehydrogenase [Verrucomicrobiota bacterium]
MKVELLKRIADREARVGIVGLGYVGLPLLIEFAKAEFEVAGFDIDTSKTEALEAGKTYIRHIAEDHIRTAISENERAFVTTDFTRLSECDALLICVPTPLTSHRDPDLSYVEETARNMAPHLRKGQLIALESTTYPGTTEDVLIPILEEGSGLTAAEDLYIAYSPEREDPNNTNFSTSTIPKVVGAFTPDALEIAQAFYDAVICKTVPVSSCRAAEATKLMENIFRCINIALVNELKMVFTEMDIDIWEVVRAASTKPFGFMPFYPGPGLGGHCIPIDPFYLTWKAKEYGISTRFIELAGEVNTGMPKYVIQRAMLALNDLGKALRGSRILLVGLAYKKNVDDDRESPTYVLWDELKKHGAEVSYFDPFCPVVRPSREHSQYAGIESRTLEEITADNFDAVIISTAHDSVDHDALASRVPVVIDTRGACKPADNVVKA